MLCRHAWITLNSRMRCTASWSNRHQNTCTVDRRIWGFVDDLFPLVTSGVKLREFSLLASVRHTFLYKSGKNLKFVECKIGNMHSWMGFFYYYPGYPHLQSCNGAWKDIWQSSSRFSLFFRRSFPVCRIKHSWFIECFHSCDYCPYWFTETKESICIKNRVQFSCDVMWKHYIGMFKVIIAVYLFLFLPRISLNIVESPHGCEKNHLTLHHKPLLTSAQFRSLFTSRPGSFLHSALLCLFLNRNFCFSSRGIWIGSQLPGNHNYCCSEYKPVQK